MQASFLWMVLFIVIFWGYLDDSQSSTGSTPSITYFWSLGVLPVLLYHFCGSYVPVSVFNSSGSTPKSTIPFFWEHSHKSGIVLVGVLPELVKCRYWEWYKGGKIKWPFLFLVCFGYRNLKNWPTDKSWVSFENSGYFQSNEYKNFVFLPKNAWDIGHQSWLPS